jgi:hypothetical protein
VVAAPGALAAGAPEPCPTAIVEVEEDGDDGVDEVVCEAAGVWRGSTSLGGAAQAANSNEAESKAIERGNEFGEP